MRLFCLNICAIFLVSCFDRPAVAQLQTSADILTDTTILRSKRAVFARIGVRAAQIGKKALRELLHGAEKLPTEGFYTLHRKKGSFQKAKEDFDSVKPTEKYTFKTPDGVAKAGTVGDRLLLLRKSGEEGLPTLEIILENRVARTPHKRNIHRIIYKE